MVYLTFLPDLQFPEYLIHDCIIHRASVLQRNLMLKIIVDTFSTRSIYTLVLIEGITLTDTFTRPQSYMAHISINITHRKSILAEQSWKYLFTRLPSTLIIFSYGCDFWTVVNEKKTVIHYAWRIKRHQHFPLVLIKSPWCSFKKFL